MDAGYDGLTVLPLWWLDIVVVRGGGGIRVDGEVKVLATNFLMRLPFFFTADVLADI